MTHSLLFSFGGFRLDAARRLLHGADGESIPLSSRAFDTLLHLVENRGRVLDKSAIMKAVWPNAVVEENNLNQCISTLRRALGERPEERRFILTVPGRGYSFVAPLEAPVSTVASATEAGQEKGAPPERTASRRSRTRLHRLLLIGLVAASAATLLLALRVGFLPLAAIDQVAVDAQVGATQASPATQDERTRAMAREMAQELARELQGRMSGAAAERGTSNVAAFEAYRRASVLLNRMGAGDTQRAIGELERAVRLDPGYARAWALLASAHASVNDAIGQPSAGALAPAEIRARTQEAAMQAAELAPDDPLVLVAAAKIAMQSRDWLNAERRLRQADALSGGADFEVNMVYGRFLADVGRPRQAIRHFRRAAELEPLLLRPSLMLESALGLAGDLGAADAEFERGRSLLGDRGIPGGSELLRAMARQDRHALESLLAAEPSAFNDFMRRGLADPEIALRELRRRFEDPQLRASAFEMRVNTHWAMVFGDHELALRSLRAALQPGLDVFFLWRPDLAPLRARPEFEQLVRDLKLTGYWLVTGQWGDFCTPLGSGEFDCASALAAAPGLASRVRPSR